MLNQNEKRSIIEKGIGIALVVIGIWFATQFPSLKDWFSMVGVSLAFIFSFVAVRDAAKERRMKAEPITIMLTNGVNAVDIGFTVRREKADRPNIMGVIGTRSNGGRYNVSHFGTKAFYEDLDLVASGVLHTLHIPLNDDETGQFDCF